MKINVLLVALMAFFAAPAFATDPIDFDDDFDHPPEVILDDGRDRGADQDDPDADPVDPVEPPVEPWLDDGRGG